jgi:diguanylate cyclase (GGDEF)-like protein
MASSRSTTSRRAARNLAPFAAASLLAWIGVLVGSSVVWWEYGLAAGLALASGLVRIAPLRGVAATTRELPPSLLFLAAVAMLRGSAGGTSSGVAVVALLPVFYTALNTSDRRQLGAVITGLAVFFLTPIMLIGAPDYPATQYRAGLLFIAVSAIIGLTTQRLVAVARFQAAEAQHRERMLEQVAQAVRGLADTPHARSAVCESARSISDASVAILYEPCDAAGTLRSTAMAGLDLPAIEIGLDTVSGVRQAFASGQSLFFNEETLEEDHKSPTPIFSEHLRQLSGSPAAALFEPLLRGSKPVGVLMIGWPRAVRVGSSRTKVAALLAHEVTGVIERADLLLKLTDMASSDHLTGLPNRRAWDARIAQALLEGQRFSVAMLDFDLFKEFNDTHGHPAGDRLLKETASAWREELRAGDLLARLGGEEFGLLLPDCDSSRAIIVVERLRARMQHRQTCSAGLACHQLGESPQALIKRADTALYEAKSAGRDRVCLHAGV